MNLRNILKLSLVIGRNNCYRYGLIETIRRAIEGGVTSVQFRDKSSSDKVLYEQAKLVLSYLPTHIPLIINDRVDIALTLQEDCQRPCGVHLGQSDLPIGAAVDLIRRVSPDTIIGLSIENTEQARRYKAIDVCYYGVGPVFPTQSKVDAAIPIGEAKLSDIVRYLSPTPCVAIGGITCDTIASLFMRQDEDEISAGLSGVAIVSAITRSNDPTKAATQLLKTINKANVCEANDANSSLHFRI